MHKRTKLLIGTISISVILSGCFQGEQSMEEMDPPPNAEAVDNLQDISDEDIVGDIVEGEVDPEETVARQLYLIDANGMVAPQTIELPNTKQVGQQVIEYLVKDGPVTELLPNGFQAVLPEGTEVLGLNLQEDGTMIVDVSEEFKDYDAADELKILESITHTLTQFENVTEVKLWINGHQQNEMPVNNTPIGEGYSRTNGINIANTDRLDLLDSQVVTMYYPSEQGETRYYVPVTQYIQVTEENEYSSIVQALIDGPGFQTNVVHVFNPDTLLMNAPDLNDGVLELVFSKDILQDSDQAVIADEVMETLVRTLTEQENVEAVDVKVEDVDQLVNENGEEYTEPVTKQTFIPTEKL